MKRTIFLGVDPSFENMGVCVHNPESNRTKMFTGDLFQVLEWLGQNCKMKQVIAVVENPNLDSAVFGVWGLIKKAINALIKYRVWQFTKKGKPPQHTTEADVQYQINMALSRAQKVGKNKAAAKLIITMLRKKGVPVIEVAPSKRDKAFKKVKEKKILKNVKLLIMPTKTTSEQFAELTGITQRSSEHARDAATLVIGRKIKQAEVLLQIQDELNKNQPSSYPKTENNNYHLVNRKTAV